MTGRVAALFLVSVVAWHAGVRDAAACSCYPGTSCELWGRSSAVFVGDVVDVQRVDRGAVARLRVVRAFKGATEASIVSVDPGSATCELRLSAGQRWVVYADTGPSGLRSSLCSGSRQLEPSAELPDLRPEAGVVDGRLLRFRAEVGVQPWIENARVWIDAPTGRIESRTGAQGSFRLSGVPVGSWTIQFALDPGESTSEQAVLEAPERCATVTAFFGSAPPPPIKR